MKGIAIADCRFPIADTNGNRHSEIGNRKNMPEWKQEIRRRLFPLELEPTRENEIVEELAQHLDDRFAELLSAGFNDDEAARVALVELSDNELLAQELRKVERRIAYEPAELGTERRNVMAGFWRDLRYGVHSLRRNLGFTFVAVLTLALGIGANTAIFSVINGVLLRPLAFHEPDRLCHALDRQSDAGNSAFTNSRRPTPICRSGGRPRLPLSKSPRSSPASPIYPTTATPSASAGLTYRRICCRRSASNRLLGRQFSADEEQPGQDRVAIISYDLWQRRFGGDAEIIGKTITVNRVPRAVIGVLPEGFNFPRATEMPQAYNLPEKADLWTPLARDATLLGEADRKENFS